MDVENVSNGECPFELAVVRDGEEAEVKKFNSLREKNKPGPTFRIHRWGNRPVPSTLCPVCLYRAVRVFRFPLPLLSP